MPLSMTQRRRLIGGSALAALVALSLLDHAGAFGYRAGDRSRYHGTEAQVIRVVDGDTLDVDIQDGNRPTTRVRLRGVDCPEIAHGPGEEDAHFGREAFDFVRNSAAGRRVQLYLDPHRANRDRYGRLLAYVHFLDAASASPGEMLNEMLIARGLAYADRRSDHVFSLQFAQRETIARRRGVGLWAGITPEQMPKWRRRD